MPDLALLKSQLDKATADLSSPDPSSTDPGKFGATLPAFIGLPLIESAAGFLESALVDYAGPAVVQWVESNHDVIARFLSPKLARFISDLFGEFSPKLK